MASSLLAAAARARNVADLEEQIVQAATADLDARLGAIADSLRAQAPAWRADPALAKRGRRALAAELRGLRPHVADSVWPRIAAGIHLDADGRAVHVEPLSDVLVRQILRRVDAKVRAKARVAAKVIAEDRLATDVQVRHAAERIIAVGSPADAAASAVAVRSATLVAVQSAGGRPVTWVCQPLCCGHCAGMAGSVSIAATGRFLPKLHVVDNPLPWVEDPDGVDGPPLHDHCRCVLVPADPGLAAALAKNAASAVAEGKVGYLSEAAKARAARRLLRARAPLNPAVRRRAANLARTAG